MLKEVIVRKWGNSMGVILPADLIRKNHLKDNDRILIGIIKTADLSHLFGTLNRDMSGQQFKNMVREGWKK